MIVVKQKNYNHAFKVVDAYLSINAFKQGNNTETTDRKHTVFVKGVLRKDCLKFGQLFIPLYNTNLS